MPLASGTISLVKYPPERLVDSEVLSITGGGAMSPPPLYIDNLDSIGKMVLLDGLITSQNAAVGVQVVADTKPWPPGGQSTTNELNNQIPDEWHIDALKSIGLSVNAASTVTNYIMSYGLWVWAPTVADKLLAGVPLASDEQALLNLLPSGWTPRITPYDLISKMYRGKKFPITGILSKVDATAPYPIAASNPPQGYFDVIVEIGVDASAADAYNLTQQLAAGLQVFIERDIDKPLQSYLAAGFPWSSTLNSDTGIWMSGVARPFIIARNSWRVYLKTAGGTANNIPFRVVIMRCLEFDAHRARWGIAGPSQDIVNQVLAGVL
jgi:hypothetical protein